MRRERSPLQVRQDPADRVAPAGLDGFAQRTVRAHEDGARDEKLGHVHVEGRLRGAERCGRKVDQHRAVVDDEHVARVEPAVRDARRMQPGDLPPQLLERPVAHLIGPRKLEWVHVRLASNHERVAIRTEGCDHDFGNPNAGLGRHEGGQRLVLDLLQSTGGGASRGILVRKKSPVPGEALRVLRIPTEHPDLQGAPLRVVADIFRGADVLLRRRPQVADLDPERHHCAAYLRRRWHARRGAEDQPRERTRAQTECEPREPSGRERGAEHNCPQSCEGNEPGGDHANRANELRSDDDDHRSRAGEPELRVTPAGQQVHLEWNPIGLDCLTQKNGHSDNADPGDEQIACKVPASARQNVDEDHGRESEQAEERGSPQCASPSEYRPQRLCDITVVSGGRRCNRCRQPDDDRCPDQEDQVDRSSIPASRLGFSQQRDAPESAG
jgi:hypothetical protein